MVEKSIKFIDDTKPNEVVFKTHADSLAEDEQEAKQHVF